MSIFSQNSAQTSSAQMAGA